VYGPCLSAIGGERALTPPSRHRLGGPLPHQLADSPQAAPGADCSFSVATTIWDYPVFRRAIPDSGVRTYVLLPRLPLSHFALASSAGAFDLHALSTPPAFILSQDQTLNNNEPR
jgi:hypothetical protein